jgi:glutamate-1-semialdehyde 2,1-aminomutase
MFEQAYRNCVDRYKSLTPKSEAAYRTARSVMPGGETRTISWHYPYPITVAYGKGSYLTDIDGNVYIDFVNNYTSLVHGHAHPHVTAAINAALEKGAGVNAAVEEQTRLAKMICERIPSVESVRFCNSGTEAVMFAIRAAKMYTGKRGIVKAIGAYHGTSDMVQFSVSSPGAGPLPVPESPAISASAASDIFVVPYNDLDAVERLFKVNASTIAALIIEPFLGSSGAIPADPDYLRGLRDLCTQYDVLYILDEIQSFRLSAGGAQKKFDVVPDITTLGKIIGGGLAVGAFGGRKRIMDVYSAEEEQHISQSGTFNGNRPTMSGGIAALELLDETAIARMDGLALQLRNAFEDSIEKHGVCASLTRAGSIVNLHFTERPPRDFQSAITHRKDLLKLYHLELMVRGIFAAPRGAWIMSTTMTEAETDRAAEAFDDVIREVAKADHKKGD